MAAGDGVLITVRQMKRWLGIESDTAAITDPDLAALAAEDDEEIADLIKDAEAKLQSWIGRRLISQPVTEVLAGGDHELRLRNYPVKAGTLVIRDLASNSAIVGADMYAADMRTGYVGFGSGRFAWPGGAGRYEVTYEGGLDQDPDWEDVIKPELRQTIRDVIKDWWENRNPSATAENLVDRAGNVLELHAIPPRVAGVWNDYKPLLY